MKKVIFLLAFFGFFASATQAQTWRYDGSTLVLVEDGQYPVVTPNGFEYTDTSSLYLSTMLTDGDTIPANNPFVRIEGTGTFKILDGADRDWFIIQNGHSTQTITLEIESTLRLSGAVIAGNTLDLKAGQVVMLQRTNNQWKGSILVSDSDIVIEGTDGITAIEKTLGLSEMFKLDADGDTFPHTERYFRTTVTGTFSLTDAADGDWYIVQNGGANKTATINYPAGTFRVNGSNVSSIKLDEGQVAVLQRFNTQWRGTVLQTAIPEGVDEVNISSNPTLTAAQVARTGRFLLTGTGTLTIPAMVQDMVDYDIKLQFAATGTATIQVGHALETLNGVTNGSTTITASSGFKTFQAYDLGVYYTN